MGPLISGCAASSAPGGLYLRSRSRHHGWVGRSRVRLPIYRARADRGDAGPHAEYAQRSVRIGASVRARLSIMVASLFDRSMLPSPTHIGILQATAISHLARTVQSPACY